MANLSFKLGDKVVVSAGPYSGCEGYIVLINGDQGACSITVRLNDGLEKDLLVKPQEIHRTT